MEQNHWDPNHPNHFHILDGKLAPVNYSGTDGVVQYADGIDDPKVTQYIKEHQAAMDNDEYKYIDNPQYANITNKLSLAKDIYDWGNSLRSVYPTNKTQWEFNWPDRQGLIFDTDGIGYKDGKTYLPGSGYSPYQVVVPGPSDYAYSENYNYLPTDIPPKQILRSEFPTPRTISKEVYELERQRAIDEYINGNTTKETVTVPDKIEYEPYGHFEDWVYPIRITDKPRIGSRLGDRIRGFFHEKYSDQSWTNPYILKQFANSSSVKKRAIVDNDDPYNFYLEYNPLTKHTKITKMPIDDITPGRIINRKALSKYNQVNPAFKPKRYIVPFDGDPFDEKYIQMYNTKYNNPELYETIKRPMRTPPTGYMGNGVYTDGHVNPVSGVAMGANPAEHKGMPFNFGRATNRQVFDTKTEYLSKIYNSKITQGADKLINKLFTENFIYDEPTPYFRTNDYPFDRNIVIEGYKPKVVQKGLSETKIHKPSREEAEQNVEINYGNL